MYGRKLPDVFRYCYHVLLWSGWKIEEEGEWKLALKDHVALIGFQEISKGNEIVVFSNFLSVNRSLWVACY